MVSKLIIFGPVVTMVDRSITSIDHTEIKETLNQIDEEIERIKVGLGEGIARIKVGLEEMMVVLERKARQEELKIVATANCQSKIDHKEELECFKVSDPINGQTTLEDSPIELVNFELSNLSHVHSKEISMKKTSYAYKVLDEMPKRDLDALSLYSDPIERNNKTEAFEDLFCDAFCIDNESDVKAFENMHLGGLFLNDVSNMDTKSLGSDWKEVLSWQARFDFIVSKIMSSCDLWLDFESDMKSWAKILPWEGSEKSLVLLTEERTEVWVENTKVIQLRMSIFDHEVYFVDCCIAAQLEAINYRDSSPYSTFEDLKENGGNQLFMSIYSPFPLFRNTILTVEGAVFSGQHGQPFAAINILGRTDEYCENGFNLGGTGEKMPERIVTKDILTALWNQLLMK